MIQVEIVVVKNLLTRSFDGPLNQWKNGFVLRQAGCKIKTLTLHTFHGSRSHVGILEPNVSEDVHRPRVNSLPGKLTLKPRPMTTSYCIFVILTLRKPLFVRPTAPETSPFLPDAAAIAALPRVAVKFLNGKTVKAEWIVNRLITFVGRSKDCKISLAADDIAPFHCYFVLTPDGLWVVDLLSRESITVNGEAVRYAHLKTGDFVQVGRFRLGFEYHSEPSLAQPIPSARSLGVKSDKSGFTPVPFLAPKVRTAPLIESATPALSRTPPPNFVAVPSHAALALPDPADPAYAPLMEHFSTAQNQMMEQFQSSMMMMMKMFGEMHREQMTSMQGELGRMAELNTEMQRLQAQLTTMTPPPVAAMKPTHKLPDPELVPLMSEESAGRHNWVYERMAVLQAERQSLWQRLAGLMTPKNAGA